MFMNIHQKFHEILVNASKKDKSKCQRILSSLTRDINVLKFNYSEHLYKLYREYYIHHIDFEKNNFEDNSIPSHLVNKCVTLLLQSRRKFLKKRK